MMVWAEKMDEEGREFGRSWEGDARMLSGMGCWMMDVWVMSLEMKSGSL